MHAFPGFFFPTTTPQPPQHFSSDKPASHGRTDTSMTHSVRTADRPVLPPGHFDLRSDRSEHLAQRDDSLQSEKSSHHSLEVERKIYVLVVMARQLPTGSGGTLPPMVAAPQLPFGADPGVLRETMASTAHDISLRTCRTVGDQLLPFIRCVDDDDTVDFVASLLWENQRRSQGRLR